MEGCPVITPWLRNLAYQYDVQRISASYRPAEPPAQPTFLAVYRRADDEIVFLELNALTARLLQQLVDTPGRSGREQLQILAKEMGGNVQQLLDFGARLLADMHQREIILGIRPD